MTDTPRSIRGRPRKTSMLSKIVSVQLEPEHMALLETMRREYGVSTNADMIRALLTSLVQTP